MANGFQSPEAVPENLRKRLAIAVRSIQWSYAIFWSLSTTKPEVLEWRDGYYNGDIKTRKMFHAMESVADKMGLQRCQQLRELYESLLEGETDQQPKRSSASLSPEDLTDAEWYYLVCMSFVFDIGQGLPGRALANNQTIWLCDAQYADSKIFSRSLLAKSASIQTILCIPHLGGVIELGVTELIREDPSLIQHIKTSLLDFSKPICSEKSFSASPSRDNDREATCALVGHGMVNEMALESNCSPYEGIRFGPMQDVLYEEFGMASPGECSDGCEHYIHTEDSFIQADVDGGASQVQSGHFMDGDYSTGFRGSINSSDCVSFLNRENVFEAPSNTKLSSLALGVNDLHYRRIISTVLGKSQKLIGSLASHTCDHRTSFRSWRGGICDGLKPWLRQKMLKKILISVPLMHDGFSLRPRKEIGGEERVCHAEDERFSVLRSLIPSTNKIDKASILRATINYVRELEARVKELGSRADLVECEARARRRNPDIKEQTSDNYDNRNIGNSKKQWVNKRKVSDIDESDLELSGVCPPNEGQQIDLKVSVQEHGVLIEMKCLWREYLLLDVIDAISSLHLDAQSVKSSTCDGILTLIVHSKFRGAAVASAGMIKQALRRVTSKC